MRRLLLWLCVSLTGLSVSARRAASFTSVNEVPMLVSSTSFSDSVALTPAEPPLSTLYLPSQGKINRMPIAFKWNALYTPLGILNPQFEIPFSRHSSFQTEVVYSPWNSIHDKKLRFGIFMTEYRWHFRSAYEGFYFGANLGMMIFKITKPYWDHGLQWENRYGKGAGMLIGLSVGYTHTFRRHWVLDAFFGWSFMSSFYNGYRTSTHEIDMHPHGHENYNPPDPFNGSAEWYPNKVGLSIGYIFNTRTERYRAHPRYRY